MVGAIPASVQGHELASYFTMLPVQPLGCQSGDVGLHLINRLPSISLTESMRCVPHKPFPLSLVHHCDPGKKINKFVDMSSYCAPIFSCCRLLQGHPNHTDGVEPVSSPTPAGRPPIPDCRRRSLRRSQPRWMKSGSRAASSTIASRPPSPCTRSSETDLF